MNSHRILTAICILFACTPVCASEVLGDLLQDGIEMYKLKRYDDAAKLFTERIQSNKDDAAAYYYLGNCCAALGKLEAANQNYEECLKHKPTADVAKFATQMRAQLQKRLPAAGTADGGAAAPPPPSPFEQNVQAIKKGMHEQKMRDADQKIAALQAQIDRIKADLGGAANQPVYMFGGPPGQRFVNPNYSAQASAQYKIGELEGKITQIRRELRANLAQEDARIDATYGELQTQARATAGSIKPIITPRSMHVRDYVHFTGDEAPPDFSVTPMKAGPAGKYQK